MATPAAVASASSPSGSSSPFVTITQGIGNDKKVRRIRSRSAGARERR